MALRDPRQIITPDAFTVAPELLGIGLARPSRRLMAIGIDGILIAILSQIGGQTLFALGAAFMLWRAATAQKTATVAADHPTADGSSQPAPQRRLIRTALRVASIAALAIFLWTAYGWVTGTVRGLNKKAVVDDSGRLTVSAGTNERNDLKRLGLGLGDIGIMSALKDFETADDSAAAAPLADSLARWVARKPEAGRAELAAGLIESMDDADGLPALRASLAPMLPDDSAIAVALVDDTASARADSARRELERLRADNERLHDENETLKDKEEEAAGGFSVMRIFRWMSDVMGFGLGWTALYFTTFTMMMRGQTPGKKILGIRIIRLDGRPITWWTAFERFGGYAASAATGLLGFAQVLWDRNRQGIHDKVAETVVIREKGGVPVRPLDGLGGEHIRPFRAPPV